MATEILGSFRSDIGSSKFIMPN